LAYAPPFGREAITAAIDDGFTRLVFVPMFPHACKATTVAIEKMLRAAAKPYRATITELHVIPEWFREPDLLDDAAAAINDARKEAGLDARVVLVFHGVPQSFPDRFGDPYAAQTRRHTDLITRRLPGMTRNRVHVGYQSRIGPAKWLEPNVIDLIRGLGENGEKKVVVAPLSFVTDHIETLVELDIELRELAHIAGVEIFRAAAPNARPGFVHGVAAHIVRSLRGEVTADPDEDDRDHLHIEGSGCCTD
jgi:ferrochelatase